MLLQDALATVCASDGFNRTEIIKAARHLWSLQTSRRFRRRPNGAPRLDTGKRHKWRNTFALKSEAAFRRSRRLSVQAALQDRDRRDQNPGQELPSDLSLAFMDIQEFVESSAGTSVQNLEDSMIREYAFNQNKMRISVLEALENRALTSTEVQGLVRQLGSWDRLAEELLGFQAARAVRAKNKQKEYAVQTLKRKERPRPALEGCSVFVDAAVDSEQLHSSLRREGLRLVLSVDEAQVVVTNKSADNLPLIWTLAMALRGGAVVKA